MWKKCRCDELEAQQRSLEARMKTIELDWAETYQKLKRAVGRVSKENALDSAKTESEKQLTLADRENILLRARRAQ